MSFFPWAGGIGGGIEWGGAPQVVEDNVQDPPRSPACHDPSLFIGRPRAIAAAGAEVGG